MLDAKTISATLTLALLTGCAGKPAATPDAEQPPVTHAPADSDMQGDAPIGDPSAAEPTAATDGSKADAPKSDATPALPGGRAEPLPPKDAKPITSKAESKRTGAMACCGEGTCGECAPLPAKRTEPKPPKDGKVVPASKSARKGTQACCGEGTCASC